VADIVFGGFVAVFLIAFVAMLIKSVRDSRSRYDALETFGGQLEDAQVSIDRGFFGHGDESRVSGVWHGRRVKISFRTTGVGQYRRHWAIYSLGVSGARAAPFRLSAPSPPLRWLQGLGLKRSDRPWAGHAPPPPLDTPRAVSDLEDLFVSCRASQVELTGAALQVEQPLTITSDITQDQLQRLFQALQRTADRLESRS
jgi:hypothetical protein